MKYIVTFLYTFLIISSAASATDKQVPFGSELQSSIKNYNRATSTLATSGTISTGGVKELAEKGFATIIDRSTKKNLKIKKNIISHMKIDVPTYKSSKLPELLKKTPITVPGSRFIKWKKDLVLI